MSDRLDEFHAYRQKMNERILAIGYHGTKSFLNFL